MVAMEVRAFPRTKREPRKRILLIPIILIVGGLLLILAHPYLRFIGTVIALTGSLTVFIVGMIFADLWASARRTKQIVKEREARKNEQGATLSKEGVDEDDIADADPFKESFDETE
jgi:hypothetical protein